MTIDTSVAQSALCLLVWISICFIQFTATFQVPIDLRLSLTLCEKAKSGKTDARAKPCPIDGVNFVTFNVDYTKKWRDGRPLLVVFRQYKPDFVKSSNCSYHIALDECFLQNTNRARFLGAPDYRSYLIQRGCPVSNSLRFLPNKTSLTTCLDSDVSLAVRISLSETLAGPAVVPPVGYNFHLECKAVLCSPHQATATLPRCPSYNFRRKTCKDIKYGRSQNREEQTLKSERFYFSKKRRPIPTPPPPTTPTTTPPTTPPTTPTTTPTTTHNVSTTNTSSIPPSTPSVLSSNCSRSTSEETTSSTPSQSDKRRKTGSIVVTVGVTSGSSTLLIAGTAVVIYLIVRRHRNIVSSYSGKRERE
ncbi:uncharacterized protein [Oscarella lobularis]|uniref:uncharacterized protein isoform X2 n=1 Tax=Oscarella lobularis TaxID=121494 RepID=UPI003313C045